MTTESEPDQPQPDPVLEDLIRENYRLKTWIAGLLAECEGCTADVKEWAKAIDLSHGTPEK